MHGKSRVSSVKYDCFKLGDSWNCIIRIDMAALYLI